LPIDAAVADEWGRVVARHESLGRTMHAMDALIAATAQVHALTIVTRNASDFAASVKSIVNPWRWRGSRGVIIKPPGLGLYFTRTRTGRAGAAQILSALSSWYEFIIL